MHSLLLLGGLALSLSVDAFAVTSMPDVTPTLDARGIIPTTSGQIGVNPVEEELGEPSTYVADIGTDTGLLTLAGGTTHWIGVNTEYLTMETITSGASTTTSTLTVLVETASAPANGQSVGDIAVVLPQALADSIQGSVNTAVASCGALNVKVKRDINSALQCLIQAGAKATSQGGLFDSYETVDWASIGLTLAENADQFLAGALQALSKSQQTKLILWMAAAAGGGMLAGKVVGKINIPKLGFGAPMTTPSTPSQPSVSASASASCAPSGKPDVNSPLCTDSDCQGTNNKTCRVSPNQNCACLIMATADDQWYDQTYMNLQQQMIGSIDAGVFLPSGFSGSTSMSMPSATSMPLTSGASRRTNTGSSSSGSASTWFGSTSVCIGLSPGGGCSAFTVPAGCYAPVPSWNFIPSITCTSGVSSAPSKPASSASAPASSADPNRAHPASNPSCTPNTAKYIDQWDKDATGKMVTPESLFFSMRRVLCSNTCSAPANIPSYAYAATPVNSGAGCELAISLSNQIEIYAYRATHATNAEWQDCWDSFATITDTCIKRGPNSGSVSGPDQNELFQAGARAQNDPNSYHMKANPPVKFSNSLLPTFISCSGNGGCGTQAQEPFGICPSTAGPLAGELCCGSNIMKCTDPQCNPVGSQCTGKANGCLCTFNGP